MAATKQYTVVSPLLLDHVRHDPGDTVELDAKQARELVGNGTVAPLQDKGKVDKPPA